MVFLGCSATPSSYTEDKVQAKEVQPAADDDTPKKSETSKAPASESTSASKPVEATPAKDEPAAAPAPAKEDACSNAGPIVYAFEDATGAWRYSLEETAPDGFTSRGPVFRGAARDAATVPLYELKNEGNGDYLVSTVPTEGSQIGYGAFAVLGQVALEKVDGMVPLVRYLQESPTLRHRVAIDGQYGAGWEPEPARGFVCPL
jgi:hypothetical protein